MDNHLSLINATKDDLGVGGIQDVEEEDLHYLDNKRFAFSDNKSGLVSNHSSPSLAILILSSSEKFPEVEELYAISQGGRIICNEVGIAVSTTKSSIYLDRSENKIFSKSEAKKIKSPISIGVTRAI